MSANEEDLDWERRRLCPDGGCLGVLGDDGVCSVCGQVGVPAYRDGGSAQVEEEDEEDDEEDELAASAEAEVSAEHDDDDRELCPDGTCVGLIGPDGTCKVCGARARA